MQKRFYVDTSVWLDLLYDRNNGIIPLGELAFQFLKNCAEKDCILLYSRAVALEFENISKQSFVEFCDFLGLRVVEIKVSLFQTMESRKISSERQLPSFDVLHAIIARDNHAIIVTRDKHFEELKDIVDFCFPEQVNFF